MQDVDFILSLIIDLTMVKFMSQLIGAATL
jgi:hypothetical protein